MDTRGLVVLYAYPSFRLHPRPSLTATKEKTEGVKVPLELTLDTAVEYIAADELLEVTPESIRMCKAPGWNKKGKK